jgi:hypothetical protein
MRERLIKVNIQHHLFSIMVGTFAIVIANVPARKEADSKERTQCHVALEYQPSGSPDFGSAVYLHNFDSEDRLVRVRVTGYTEGPSSNNYPIGPWQRVFIGYSMERSQRFSYKITNCK